MNKGGNLPPKNAEKLLISKTEQYLIQKIFNMIVEKIWLHFIIAYIIATVLW